MCFIVVSFFKAFCQLMMQKSISQVSLSRSVVSLSCHPLHQQVNILAHRRSVLAIVDSLKIHSPSPPSIPSLPLPPSLSCLTSSSGVSPPSLSLLTSSCSTLSPLPPSPSSLPCLASSPVISPPSPPFPASPYSLPPSSPPSSSVSSPLSSPAARPPEKPDSLPYSPEPGPSTHSLTRRSLLSNSRATLPTPSGSRLARNPIFRCFPRTDSFFACSVPDVGFLAASSRVFASGAVVPPSPLSSSTRSPRVFCRVG